MPVLLGLLGVLGFSFTLPVTRVAVEGLDPAFVGLGRAAVAAFPAAVLLAIWRERLPDRATLARLALVALGVVFGFPLLSALALRELTAAHSAVIVGLLPAATAVMAVARAGERPSAGFWVASGAGLAAVLGFAASQGAGVSVADLLVLAAVALGAIGYAEGGALARDMGGNRVICWALVLSLPLTLPIGAVAAVAGGVDAPADAWLGFAYLAIVSPVPRVLRLVRGARARRRGQDRPGPTGAAAAHARLGCRVLRRVGRRRDPDRLAGGRGQRRGDAAGPRGPGKTPHVAEFGAGHRLLALIASPG